jgi:phosphate/phosphite/phosphonate ABC transporter binding protein
MNRRTILPALVLAASFVLTNCNLPRLQAVEPTAPAVTPTETIPPPPTSRTAELGLVENPLILALPPSANSPEQIDAAKLIASQLTERTGYVVVTVIPDSYTALVDAFEQGNAHIALFEPYAYELAYQRGLVKATYAVLKEGVGKYGAQFIATSKAGFNPYFNPLNGTNTLNDPEIALAQFNDKKPCWSDEASPSGYVIPLGYLNASQVTPRSAAFVEGHPTVVRSLYASGICDFGATYIDARKFPSLEDEFPDLMEQVVVIWRIPEIIPYDVFAFSTAMPQPMRDLFSRNIAAILQTDQGKNAFLTAYHIEEISPVNDGYYEEFRLYLQFSGIDLSTLVK